MKPKTKIVEISGTRYQLRKLAPDVGSYISFLILGASLKTGSLGGESQNIGGGDERATVTDAVSETDADGESRGEMLVRAVAFRAFLGGLNYEMHSFVQQKCLSACSRMESRDGVELPMPIVTDSGQWAIPEIREDIRLVVRLELEALTFSCASFFAGGGLNALAGNPAPAA